MHALHDDDDVEEEQEEEEEEKPRSRRSSIYYNKLSISRCYEKRTTRHCEKEELYNDTLITRRSREPKSQ
jgi:hypothetical protein